MFPTFINYTTLSVPNSIQIPNNLNNINNIINIQNNNNNINNNNNNNNRKKRSKNALLHFIAGGIGGAAGVICTSPLEVIKTQLQAKNSNLLVKDKPRFVPTTAYSLYHLVKRDGKSGLWKGLGAHLLGVAPARAIHFSSYSFTKSIMNKLGYTDGPILWITSAVSSGAAVAITTSPIWLIKTRMQLQTSLKNFNEGTQYRGMFHCCLSILREEGPLGFYKGLGASLISVSESAFQFVLYEGFKNRIITEKRLKGYENPNELSTSEYLISAGIAKLIAAITTYPHEVVRTRLREQTKPGVKSKYTGVIQGLTLIAREEGIRGLFGGAGPHIIRVVPNSCIMFLTYELVLDIAHGVSLLFDTNHYRQ
ncbi:mitochondrial substrate carrier family protein [Dictyostelium discoideum AX4]|uniref:Mitochondrial substrate carrier family protein n=1 Tax=Dictyostelium discoideum TaxID=44689 RepID=Q54Z02_DICDI|nr:mitochondrial substrate carrier family protein [Dictyostelium discoideum AX4]EAL68118.1 mitochondrial substrate carrier family protein [Dictyostelium discoideum AX4]|eukprot:XP_642050.1 mitochondrial substrate carrier family protein [Dictyostelium discoideum AX4]